MIKKILWAVGVIFHLYAFSECKNEQALTHIDGNIAKAENQHYFLYGYYTNQFQTSINWPWQCEAQKILGFDVISSQESMAYMREHHFEIAPIYLDDDDFYSFWQKRVALPIRPLLSEKKEIYQYLLIYGRVKDFRRYSRSYQIHLILDNNVELSLFIPSSFFSFFDFKRKNFKKGDYIYAVGLSEYWKRGYVMQITHPNQLTTLKDAKIQRAIKQQAP